jgi:nitrogen-specific signal transduction histidine kinase
MDFTAVAHDLRTPLNVMLGHMRLLAIESLSATGRHRLEVLEAQIHRMMRLLDTCGEQHSGVPFVASVDLAVLVGNVVSELDAVLEREGIEIASTIDGTLPFVVGNGDLPHRVLLNVLINATDSMAGGTTSSAVVKTRKSCRYCVAPDRRQHPETLWQLRRQNATVARRHILRKTRKQSPEDQRREWHSRCSWFGVGSIRV